MHRWFLRSPQKCCLKESRHPMRIHLLLTMLIIASIVGCKRSEQRQIVQPKITQDQQALANAHSKIQELSAQIDQLKIENQRLKAKNDFLASQNKDIQPRMQQLIAGYGTGIWDYGENMNYPVFVKSMKGADVRDVIAALNKRFQHFKQPKIGFKKKEGSTVFIGVDNEEQLDEQMGSDGALSYMTAVAYSLTSAKGIDCVYFDIGEGEHASPGKYCKDSLEPFSPK
jgi:TolA-binding protein